MSTRAHETQATANITPAGVRNGYLPRTDHASTIVASAFDVSRCGRQEIGEAAGVSKSKACQWAQAGSGSTINLGHLLEIRKRFPSFFGAVVSALDSLRQNKPGPNLPALMHLGITGKEAGDVCRAVVHAMADGSVSKDEARSILPEVDETIAAFLAMRADLHRIANS
jgi:hypothetical protein